MDIMSRGIRGVVRNTTRTVSIVIILGLALGLSLIMLIAHQAVTRQINITLSSIGTTVSISPAGFSEGSAVNNALTATELAKVAKISHVTSLDEELTDRLQTTGTTSQPNFPGGAGGKMIAPDTSNNYTSLKSPVSLNCSGSSCSSGGAGGGMRIQADGGGGALTLPSNFSLPIAIMGTNQPLSMDNGPTPGAASIKVVSGHAISGSADVNDAMVSQAMATKNNLKIGSTFTAYNKTLTVTGIYSTSDQNGPQPIIVSLRAEQRLTAQAGVVTRAAATVDSLKNLSAATSAIQRTLGTSADAQSSVQQANQALGPLNTIQTVSMDSLIGSVIAGAIIILLTMIMVVRERKREIGIVKAIGFSNVRIMFQFMVEALTLTLLSLVIGLVLGIWAGSPVTTLLTANGSNGAGPMPAPGGGEVKRIGGPLLAGINAVHAQIGWSILLYGLLAAAFIAIAGSALASFFIAKVKPAEVLRSE